MRWTLVAGHEILSLEIVSNNQTADVPQQNTGTWRCYRCCFDSGSDGLRLGGASTCDSASSFAFPNHVFFSDEDSIVPQSHAEGLVFLCIEKCTEVRPGWQCRFVQDYAAPVKKKLRHAVCSFLDGGTFFDRNISGFLSLPSASQFSLSRE